MLSIDCPWCGAREQTEFAYGGEAHIVRPENLPNSESLSDGDLLPPWGDYVFHRANPRGAHFERWNHDAFGCRRWFHLARDTASGRVYFGAYQIADPKPAVAVAAPESESNSDSDSRPAAAQAAK